MKILRWEISRRDKKTKKTTPKTQTSKSFKNVKEYQKHLTTMRCPSCNKNGDFSLQSYELGSEGWEAIIRCKPCESVGTINHTGFKFILIKRGESK